MKKVSHKAPKVKAIHKDDKTPDTSREEELDALDTRIALIQALIPLFNTSDRFFSKGYKKS